MAPLALLHREHASITTSHSATGTLPRGISPGSKFKDDVLSGLRAGIGNKRIDAKYLYDDAKPDMFDRLTRIPAYYPTDADIRTLEYHLDEIVGALPDRCIACEIGGNSRGRTIPLLQACIDQGKVSTFFQIDICDPTQSTSLDALKRELTVPRGVSIELQGIRADTDSLDFSVLNVPKPEVAFVFGGTALNCKPKDIPARLADWSKRLGRKLFFTAGTIVDDQTFLNAYNEPEAVHVEWFIGLLERINRELEGTFDLEKVTKCTDARDPYRYWAYEIELNEQKPWKFISMYLTSKVAQNVRIAGEFIAFGEGERIHIADTCRIDPVDLPRILGSHGLVVEHAWVDPKGQSAIYSIAESKLVKMTLKSDFIREFVHNLNRQGLEPLIDAIKAKARELLPLSDRTDLILHQLDALLDRASEEDDLDVSRARFSGILRYLLEDGGYHVDESVQLHHLINEGVLRSGIPLIDLGPGSAEAVKEWATRGNPALGIDASPSFVEACDLLHLGLIDADVQPLSELAAHLSTNRLVISSLTLDRVAKPKQLARNMIDLAGAKGNFMLASLFPIISYDDEDVTHPIMYTPHQHRIATTGTEDGDLAAVVEFLQNYSGRKIKIKRLPYTVTTHSGVQVYDNYHALWTADE